MHIYIDIHILEYTEVCKIANKLFKSFKLKLIINHVFRN